LNQDIKLPTINKGRKSETQTIIYNQELKDFSEKLIQLQYEIAGKTTIDSDDKVSARGWCYLLEGDNIITKGEFEQCFKIINYCRKNGYLPIDFVAQDKSREFFNTESLEADKLKPKEYLIDYLDFVKDIEKRKNDIAFWESQKYYIQVIVEKIDVRNLFNDICEKYHIPIANAKGWSDMLMRDDLISRYKEAEAIGLIPVLLYYGDFDPAGIKIADTIRENLKQLEKATNWNPKNLIIDHFGLTIDFINENSILWIDNLETGGKRNLGNLYKQYKEGKKVKLFEYEINYIEKYGVRKCEANAILKIRKKAINQCEQIIQKYLGIDPFETYDKEIKKTRKAVYELMEKVNYKSKIQNLIDEINNQNQNNYNKGMMKMDLIKIKCEKCWYFRTKCILNINKPKECKCFSKKE
jgi:hypothetical protein